MDDLVTSDFWDISPTSKIDQISDKRPAHLQKILWSLRDRHTMIEEMKDGYYMFYGKEQALLVSIKSKHLQSFIDIYKTLFLY